MPTAICTQCSDILHWRNQRSAKLADFKCRNCGGAYKAATWTPEGWKLRVAQSGHKGRQKAECLCCGGLTPLREQRARTVKMMMSHIDLDSHKWTQVIWTIQIEEGDPICSRCRPYEYLLTFDLGIETHDWLYKQVNGVGVNYHFPTE
jgi:uncharacterized Zn finger protein